MALYLYRKLLGIWDLLSIYCVSMQVKEILVIF